MKQYTFLLSLLISLNVTAQEIKQSAFTFNYNYQIPIGHLSNTYGDNSAVGGSYFLETIKNIFVGLEGSFRFGSNIKDSTIFENISTASGSIINGNGNYANINLMQRGFDGYFFAGYAYHIKDKNLSGFYIYQGIGYLQHKIFIDTKNQNIPQLDEEMKRGYDKFSSGYSTKFSIDYKYYDKNGKFQISSGFNYTLAYTQNQRSYDFANNKPYSDKKKWDKLLSIKAEIIIPIKRKNQEEFHYY